MKIILLCTICLILISGCGTYDADEQWQTEQARIKKMLAQDEQKQQTRDEELKQIIANRERIFTEAEKRRKQRLETIETLNYFKYLSKKLKISLITSGFGL